MSVEDLQEKVSLLEHELESERTAHDRDRQKLRKLEHLLLMAEKNKAAYHLLGSQPGWPQPFPDLPRCAPFGSTLVRQFFF